MNVGLWLGDEAPESGGGYTFVSEIFHHLANNSQNSRHKFTLLSWRQSPPEKLSLENLRFVTLHRNGIDRTLSAISRRYQSIKKKLNHPLSHYAVAGWRDDHVKKLLARNEIDIIWNLSPASLCYDLPSIITVWDLQHRYQPFFPEVSIGGRWSSRESYYGTAIRRAARIITGTEVGKKEIERFYQVPSDNIRVIPFPVPTICEKDTETAPENLFAKYGIPPRYLYYPAQFWPHKNHIGLLFAIKYLKDIHGMVCPVVFTGSDKGNENHVRNMVEKLDLTSQVFFLGYVPRADMSSLYRNALALVFVSFFGPDNLPPLEAFAHSCPVIASDVPGATEQLGDASLLVDPRDEVAIACAIKKVMADQDLRQELISKGHARLSNYSSGAYIASMFDVIDSLEPVRRCWSNTEIYGDKRQ